MSTHATLPPSAAHRWLHCAGSVALEATMPASTSKYADDGTVSHILAARCFAHEKPADFFIGTEIQLNEGTPIYVIEEARAERVQMYVNDVLARAKGGQLLFECKLELDDVLGQPEQFGTSDAIILQPDELIVEDLKDGAGEKIFAAENPQLMLYALGALKIAAMYGPVPHKIKLVICQPKLDHIDEWELDVNRLRLFGEAAKRSASAAIHALTFGGDKGDLNPGEKTCRWCRAKAICPALDSKVQADIGVEFARMQAEPLRVDHVDNLATQFAALPLIEQWCSAVREEVVARVMAGATVLGTDDLPLKMIEGKRGNRAWTDERKAEGALAGLLPADKVYVRKVITPAVADKLLKKQPQVWQDVFVPLVKQAPGRPHIALGSAEGIPWTGTATAAEFDNSEDLTQ